MCSDELGIQCETEYFGLVYKQRRSRNSLTDETLQGDMPTSDQILATESESGSRVRQWLNLRNPLRTDGNFLNLALRVKFWVPVHLILQESARSLFYMEARQSLLENRLYASDWENAVKLAALMAHADGIRSEGRGELDGQRRGAKRKSSDQWNASVPLPIPSLAVYEPYTSVRPNPKLKMPGMTKDQYCHAIAQEHQKISHQKRSSAKYWLLFELEKLEGFGQEQFIVPTEGSHTEILVGPEGVVYVKGDEHTK